MYIVSACLAGVACRYDGQSQPDPRVLEMVRRGLALPVCPEQLGGLPTPRTPFEIVDGRVVSREGEDATDAFMRGAEEAARLASLAGCTKAVLKQRSPSCGSGKIYDGTFSGRIISGSGLFSKHLKEMGIVIFTEEHTGGFPLD